MKKISGLLCVLCGILLFSSGCGLLESKETLPIGPEVSPLYSPYENTENDTQKPTVDIDGDGVQDTITLHLVQNGTSAIICVNGVEVFPIAARGEFNFSFAQIVTEDMDSDGKDEVILCSKIPARYGGFTFQYVEYENNTWRELCAEWPKTELTLSERWQCTLTVNGMQQTIEITNTDMRDAYFDKSGTPYAKDIYIGFYTDAAEHIIEGNNIIFTRYIAVRGKGVSGFEPGFEFMFPCTVSVKDGKLIIDDEDLCANILLAFQ